MTCSVYFAELVRWLVVLSEPGGYLSELLTEREREILQLLARGESNKAIANTLSIGYDTVKQHVRHILTKLNLSSRVKAAVLFSTEQNTPSNDDRSSHHWERRRPQ